jgi:uncharacterized protein YtpQ (UPF0354 family)
MALYIGNCSKQTFEFNYWVGENKKYFTTVIRHGGQESVFEKGTRQDHEYIVDQHKIYGLIPVSEIDRSKEFVGLCYQYDKPITLDRLQTTFDHNDEVMAHASQEHRKIATLAMDDILNRSAQNSDATLQNFEVGIVEQAQKGVDTQVNETITVENPASRSRGRPRKEG